MRRATIDLDAAVRRELKRRQRSQGRTVGQLASEGLAAAPASEAAATRPTRFRWRTQRMGARVDLDDKAAVRRALEERGS